MRLYIFLSVLFFSTTALAQPACECAVTFSITGTAEVSALQFDTTYVNGNFRGIGSSVDCGMLQGSFAAFNDLDNLGILRTAVIGFQSGVMQSPGTVVSCTFDTDNRSLGTRDFGIDITTITTLSPSTGMGVEVSSVVCLCQPEPTTTSTTTTTLGPECRLDGECGDICWHCSPVGSCELACGRPISSEPLPLVSDVLFILQTAVGIESCPLCLCDTNGNGEITSDDAQISLYLSVELDATADCSQGVTPGVTVTTTLPTTTTTTTLNTDVGLSIYDAECGLCHLLGDLDVIGFAPDLAGKGSLLVPNVSTITAAHPSNLIYSQAEIDSLAAFLDSN